MLAVFVRLSGLKLLGSPLYPITVSFDPSPSFVFVYLRSFTYHREVVSTPYDMISFYGLLTTGFEEVLPGFQFCASPNSAFG